MTPGVRMLITEREAAKVRYRNYTHNNISAYRVDSVIYVTRRLYLRILSTRQKPLFDFILLVNHDAISKLDFYVGASL